MHRAISFIVVSLLAGAPIHPVAAQQRPPSVIFDANALRSVYTPLWSGAGTAGATAAPRSGYSGSSARGEVEGGPAEGRSTGALVAGGLAGGVAGAIAGGAVGAWLFNLNCEVGCDEGALYSSLLGAMVGESLLLPLGVHLTNRRLGSYYPAMMASVTVTGAAVGLVYLLSQTFDHVGNTRGLVVAVPVLQLIASIQIERQTAIH